MRSGSRARRGASISSLALPPATATATTSLAPGAAPTSGRRPDEGGSTLIELVSALAFALFLLGAAISGVASHQAQRRAHGERILAMSACRNTLERLRSVAIDDLESYDGQGFDVPGRNGEAGGLPPLPGDADGLAGDIDVTRHPTLWTATNKLYVVTTTVRWLGATRGGNFAMETLMGERR